MLSLFKDVANADAVNYFFYLNLKDALLTKGNLLNTICSSR